MLRKAVLSIGEAKLKERLMEECTSVLDGKTILEGTDSAIARMASHRTGFEEAVTALVRVALTRDPVQIESGHTQM